MAETVLWIAKPLISPQVAAKIGSKQGSSVHDVRAAIFGQRHPARRHHHPERGVRCLVEVHSSGQRCQAVLYR